MYVPHHRVRVYVLYVLNAGKEGRACYVSWPWTAGVLPNPQSQSTEGEPIMWYIHVACTHTHTHTHTHMQTAGRSAGICTLFGRGRDCHVRRLWFACTDD